MAIGCDRSQLETHKRDVGGVQANARLEVERVGSCGGSAVVEGSATAGMRLRDEEVDGFWYGSTRC